MGEGLARPSTHGLSVCVGRLFAPTQERRASDEGLVAVAGDYASVQKALRRIVP